MLALVAFGLRAAAGRSRSDQVVETPARRDVGPTTSGPSPSTTSPSATPSTTAPRGSATTPQVVDPITPRLKVSDADGRFTVTVPRTWVNDPAALSDQTQWVPFVQQASGEFTQSEFIFAVRWGDSQGCALERCAATVVDRLKSTYPGVTPTTTPDTVGSLPAIRIEAAAGDQRLAAWVVVKGDRYWVPQMRGPAAQFDVVYQVVRDVVATMTFD